MHVLSIGFAFRPYLLAKNAGVQAPCVVIQLQSQYAQGFLQPHWISVSQRLNRIDTHLLEFLIVPSGYPPKHSQWLDLPYRLRYHFIGPFCYPRRSLFGFMIQRQFCQKRIMPMPAVTIRPSSSFTIFKMAAAIASAGPNRLCDAVTSNMDSSIL